MKATITDRIFLAAHAPAEPAAWFKVTFDPEPPRPNAEWCGPCKGDYGECEGGEQCDSLRRWQTDMADWKARRSTAESLQWPWAWADVMLKSGGYE